MDILTQLKMHSYQLSIEKGLLHGSKIDEIEVPATIANQLSESILSDYETHYPFKTIQEIDKAFLRGFIYMFDKGIEMAYFSRVSQLDEIEYSFNDLVNGFGGDNVPNYIQERVTPAISILAQIYTSIIQFIDQHNTELSDAATTKEIMKLILIGSAFIGIEFCLRIELE